MRKSKLASLLSILLITTFAFFYGCGKSDKDVTKNDKKSENRETIDTSKFYASNNLWQNYPGKSPLGADMTEITDPARIDLIRKTIAGESILDVYTCEMHPQVKQNYMGTCPICKMALIIQPRKSNTDSTQKPKKMN